MVHRATRAKDPVYVSVASDAPPESSDEEMFEEVVQNVPAKPKRAAKRPAALPADAPLFDKLAKTRDPAAVLALAQSLDCANNTTRAKFLRVIVKAAGASAPPTGPLDVEAALTSADEKKCVFEKDKLFSTNLKNFCEHVGGFERLVDTGATLSAFPGSKSVRRVGVAMLVSFGKAQIKELSQIERRLSDASRRFSAEETRSKPSATYAALRKRFEACMTSSLNEESYDDFRATLQSWRPHLSSVAAQLAEDCGRYMLQAISAENDLKSLFNDLFVRRCRDSDSSVRGDAVESLAEWVVASPEFFGKNEYLKYLAWSLNDQSSVVRTKAAKGARAIVAAAPSHMVDFVERFVERFVEMRNDPRAGVAAEALKLLEDLQRTPELASFVAEDASAVEMCLFFEDTGVSSYAEVRSAAASFLQPHVAVASDHKATLINLAGLSARQSDCIGGNTEEPSELTLRLVSSNVALYASAFTVDAFWPTCEALCDFEALFEALMEVDDPILSRFLAYMACTVASRIGASDGARIPAAEKQRRAAAQKSLDATFKSHRGAQVLRRYKPDELVSYCLARCLVACSKRAFSDSTKSRASAFENLLVIVCELCLAMTRKEPIDACFAALERLTRDDHSGSGAGLVASRATVRKLRLSLASLPIGDITAEEEEAIDEDDEFVLAADLRRASACCLVLGECEALFEAENLYEQLVACASRRVDADILNRDAVVGRAAKRRRREGEEDEPVLLGELLDPSVVKSCLEILLARSVWAATPTLEAAAVGEVSQNNIADALKYREQVTRRSYAAQRLQSSVPAYDAACSRDASALLLEVRMFFPRRLLKSSSEVVRSLAFVPPAEIQKRIALGARGALLDLVSAVGERETRLEKERSKVERMLEDLEGDDEKEAMERAFLEVKCKAVDVDNFHSDFVFTDKLYPLIQSLLFADAGAERENDVALVLLRSYDSRDADAKTEAVREACSLLAKKRPRRLLEWVFYTLKTSYHRALRHWQESDDDSRFAEAASNANDLAKLFERGLVGLSGKSKAKERAATREELVTSLSSFVAKGVRKGFESAPSSLVFLQLIEPFLSLKNLDVRKEMRVEWKASLGDKLADFAEDVRTARADVEDLTEYQRSWEAFVSFERVLMKGVGAKSGGGKSGGTGKARTAGAKRKRSEESDSSAAESGDDVETSLFERAARTATRKAAPAEEGDVFDEE